MAVIDYILVIAGSVYGLALLAASVKEPKDKMSFVAWLGALIYFGLAARVLAGC